MKKIILILLLKCFSTSAQQHIYFGLKAGVNRSEVIGDGNNGYNKTGFNGGLLSQLRLTKNWSMQLEVLFSDKGCKYKYDKNTLTLYQYHLRLYYIDLPILLQFHHKKITYDFGFGLGYLIHQWEEIQNLSFNNRFNPVNTIDKSFYVGLAYFLNENGGLNFRYGNSILPIRKIPTSQFNSVFTLALFYKTDFKKKKSQNKEE